MIERLPNYIPLLFGVTTLITIIWFYLAANQSKKILIIISLWTVFTSALAYSGFFLDTYATPPNFVFGIAPTLLMIAYLFLSKKGRAFIDAIKLETLTYMSVIRVPVEITLALLFHNGAISIFQTFEGANFDILSGITAPIIAYLVFTKGSVGRKGLLIWNIICLCLLLTIIGISALALPTPFQQIAFDQPNIAILYFPFNLLTMVVVPIVLFGHLVSIRRLTRAEVGETIAKKEIVTAV